MGAFAYDLPEPLSPRIEEEIQRLQPVDYRVAGLILVPILETKEGTEGVGGYRIAFATRKFGDVTGYESTELVGQTTDWLKGSDTDLDVLADLHVSLGAAEPIDLDLLSYTKAGVAFWAHLQVHPILRGDGFVEGFAVYLGLANKSRASYLSDTWQRIEEAWTETPDSDLKV
ncbi:MAG: hypothetical protein COA62_09360 [Rhodobiaceae bacterium]|nr:MAG: hypothetical protein COA62_09360 [Rhodobiaceae bacterium]